MTDFNLQFEIEIEKKKTLNFLDLSLKINNDEIIIDWFHKEIFSFIATFLFTLTYSYLTQDRCYFQLIEVFFSHTQYIAKKNLELINILIMNNYPLRIYFQSCEEKNKISIKNHYIMTKLKRMSKTSILIKKKIFYITVFNVTNIITSYINNLLFRLIIDI